MTLQIKRYPLALPNKRISSLSKWIGYFSVFTVLAVIGVLTNNESIGQIIVVTFGVVAMVLGVKSEESIKLALAALGVILIATIFQINILAQQFAIYVFLFLCIGTLSAVREQLQAPGNVVIKSYVIRSRSHSYKVPSKVEKVFIKRRSH